MNIVDAQVHIGPGRIEETLAAMDALGIRAILIDEYWVGRKAGDPAYSVPGGAQRPVQPTAELAALLYPERFSYLVRLGRRDKDVTTVIRMARDAPHARALRITPGMRPDEVAAFAAGEYASICAAACDCGLPLFMFVPGRPGDVVRYARQYPSLRIVIDHLPAMLNRMAADARTAVEVNLQELAKRPLVWFKVSELMQVTDGKPVIDPAVYKPTLDYMFDTFGQDKLIFGSDWPNGAAVNNLPPIVRIVQNYFVAKGRAVAEKYFWKNSTKAYKWVKRDPSQP